MIHERNRLEALHAYKVLDTAPHPSFDAVTRAAQAAFDTPVALISLVDEYRQWFEACIGLDVRETPRGFSFCTHAIEQDGVYVVEDAASHPRFANNPLVLGGPRIRFYAGAPIIDAEGYALGTVCVIDRRARTITDQEREILKALADCALSAITLHSQSQLLRRAHTLIKRYMGRDLEAA